jgi:DNA repair protein RecO (recombination protein O)
MNNIQTQETSAFILRMVDLKESDRIITLLSHDLGRMDCYARGARNSKKRFIGGIDIFDFGTAIIKPHKNQDQMNTLDGFSRSESFSRFRSDFPSLIIASLATESVLAMTHDGDAQSCELFLPLKKFFQTIEEGTIDPQEAIKNLLGELFQITGFGIPIDSTLPGYLAALEDLSKKPFMRYLSML